MLTFDHEKTLLKDLNCDLYAKHLVKFYFPIMGVDEVGRGCIAGPVVAAAVVLKKTISSDILSQIKDSKKLIKTKREFLYKAIIEHSIYAISVVTVDIIEQINILNASLLAMQNASFNVVAQDQSICGILVDGRHTFPSNIKIQPLINGDNKSLNIAAASILAKVYRDNIMRQLSTKYPNYHWEHNVGYGTKKHLEALKNFSFTLYHRKNFAPIKHMMHNKYSKK